MPDLTKEFGITLKANAGVALRHWKPVDLTAEFGRCARERQIGLTVSPIGLNGCQDFICGLQGHFRCRQALGTTAW